MLKDVESTFPTFESLMAGHENRGEICGHMCGVPNSVGQCCLYNVSLLNKPLSYKIENWIMSSFTCLGSDLGSASPDKETLNLTLQKQTPLCKLCHSCRASVKRHCMFHIFSINKRLQLYSSMSQV